MNKNRISKIVNRLSVNNPKICYGIIYSEASIFNIASFSSDISKLISSEENIDQPVFLTISSDKNIKCIKNQSDALLDWVEDNEIIKNANWYTKLQDIDNYLEYYSKNNCIHTPLIVENFENLSISDQCTFVSSFRSWHQSSRNNNSNVTLVLCGSWSKAALKKE